MKPSIRSVRFFSLSAALCFGLGVGCSPVRRAQTQTPEPDLCDLDGGRWCQSCGDAGEPACPVAGSSGWLCCANGVCVAVPTVEECGGGLSGWCNNYTESQHCTAGGACVSVATCHDAG